MDRLLVELLGRRDLHHLAEVHDDDPVRDVAHDTEVVGDEHVAEMELLLEVVEQVDDLGLDGDVERRDGLVEQDQLRVDRQRPGDPDPLPLAPGELVGEAAARPGRARRGSSARGLLLRSGSAGRRGSSAASPGSARSACAGSATPGDPGRPSASRAARLQVLPADFVMSPSVADRPARRLDQPHSVRISVVLPQPGLADDPERLALVQDDETSSTACTWPTWRSMISPDLIGNGYFCRCSMSSSTWPVAVGQPQPQRPAAPAAAG